MNFWEAVGIFAVTAAAAVILIAYLSYENFIKWFQTRLTPRDKNKIGVSIRELKKNGNVRYIRCTFDKNTEEVTEKNVTEAQNSDPQIRNAHDNNGIAIWTL